MPKKKNTKTIQQLEAEIKVLRASLLCHLKAAYHDLKNCGVNRYMASGLVITITNLEGKEVVEPFMCQDGLEESTISALQQQIKKTETLALISKI